MSGVVPVGILILVAIVKAFHIFTKLRNSTSMRVQKTASILDNCNTKFVSRKVFIFYFLYLFFLWQILCFVNVFEWLEGRLRVQSPVPSDEDSLRGISEGSPPLRPWSLPSPLRPTVHVFVSVAGFKITPPGTFASTRFRPPPHMGWLDSIKSSYCAVIRLYGARSST